MDITVREENNEVEYSIDTDMFSISNKTSYFLEESERKKFIKNVEKIVRGTIEYRKLIQYIRENLELDQCSILNNLDTDVVSIELHHAPYTLYDIVDIVLMKYEMNEYLFNTLTIAEEVLALHYKNRVGLTPLSDTIHQLVHSQQLKIHRVQVIGNVDLFYNEYKEYMNEDQITKYEDYIMYSDNNANTIDPNCLFNEDNFIKQVNKISNVNNNTKQITEK